MLAPLKTEKKLKSRFFSTSPFMVIEIHISWTWDISNVLSSPSLTWLGRWKPLKSGYHVSWRGLCVLFRFFYSSYFTLVILFPEHFICHATETNFKIDRLNFSINVKIKFLKRNSIVLKLKQFSRILFSSRLLEVLVLST